jgi:hypothetical protein
MYAPTWLQVLQVVEQKLANDRAKLENPATDPQDTQTIRGRISLAKEILQLPAELERKATTLPR